MARTRARFVITAQDLSKRAFASVRASLAAVSRAVLSFQAGLAGLLGVGGLTLLVRQSLQATDSIGKLSTRLGISTEALSEYRLAARLGGIDIRTFTLAVQRMTRRVAEAAQGQGEAQKALAELNLEAEKLAELPIDEQLETLADALAGVQNEADRLRLAFRLFDSEGTAILQTFEGGAEGLRAMREEARTLGLSMSELAVSGVEAANDSLARLQSLFIGLRDQIVASLAPALETVASGLKDMILNAAEARGGITDLARDLAVNFLQAIQGVGNALFDFAEGVQKAFSIIAGAWDAVPFVRGATEVREEIAEIEKRILRLRGAFTEGDGLFNPVANEIENAEGQLVQLRRELASFEPLVINLAGAQEKWNDGLVRMIGAAREGGGVLREETAPAMREFRQETEEAGDAFVITQDEMKRSVERFGSSFVNTMFATERSFERFATAIIQDITRIVATKALIDPLAQSIANLVPGGGLNIGSIFSSLFGGGGTGAAGFAAGPMGGGFGGLFPGGQLGGQFEVPGSGGIDSALLGVRVTPGREVVSVQPKGVGGGMAGTVNVNFNITTIDATDFDRLLASRQPLIVGMVSQAMSDSFRA